MRRFVLLAFFASCQGQILGGRTSTEEGGPTADARAQRCERELAAGWGPLRRVTHQEYDSSISLLLSTSKQRSTSFPSQAKANGFTNGSAQQTVGELQAEAYFEAAEAFAAEAVKDLPALLQCDVATVGQTPCGQRFVDRLATRAFRRPLSPDEQAAYRQLLADATNQLDFSSGLEVVISAVLQSPHFLYHLERGVAVAPGLERLDGPSLAARLATSLWQSLPDQPLLDAAASGALDTPDGIEAQARRMLTDPRARPVLVRLFAELTRADELAGVPKDTNRYPTWDTLRSSMTEETSRFVESVLFNGPGTVEALLTARHTFVNPALAAHYGLPAVSGWQRVSLSGTPRLGLLTQGSVLAVNAKTNQSSPVVRGLFVRENLLCDSPPPPPQDANIVPPDIKPGVPTRQRYAEHSQNPACAGCHTLMDPIGLGFEHFDAVGAWRDLDEGVPVDASGEVVGTDAAGPFVGVEALATRLSTSHRVSQCLDTQVFRYFAGRHESAGDTCSLYRLETQFRGGAFDLRDVVVALTSSDSFRHRKTEP